jgi:hypothetical protein
MPQPTASDVHIDAALTSVSVAYMQDDDAYIADKIFPIVPVEHASDKYWVFSKSDFFRDEAQKRADSAESAGSGFGLTQASYSADVWSLHKDVGAQVKANSDPAINLDVAATDFVTQKLLIRRDRLFVQNYMTTGVWGTDWTGVVSGPTGNQSVYWSDYTNGNPFNDIENAKQRVLLNTGLMPNVLVLSYPVYRSLRTNPLIIDRIKYTMAGGAFSRNITPQLLAAAFDVDQVLVSRAVYNSAQEGTADSFSFVLGNHALLAYRTDAPNLMTPSAGYIFAWRGFTGLNNNGIRINNIPTPLLGIGSNRIEGEMAFAMPAIAADVGFFFNGIVV